MEIEQYLYDLTESGEAIVAYTMCSMSGTKVQLCNLGASVLSFTLEDGRDIASGRCILGEKGLNDDDSKERFDERLWESWVETNRVIMSTQLAIDGVDVSIEVVFDMDDDDTFEITYQAYALGDLRFDLTHALSINLGDDMSTEINGASLDDGFYAVDGAKPSILSQVATLQTATATKRMTICSSQPQLYVDGDSGIVAPVSHPAGLLAAEQRYIQKSLFRLE